MDGILLTAHFHGLISEAAVGIMINSLISGPCYHDVKFAGMFNNFEFNWVITPEFALVWNNFALLSPSLSTVIHLY